MSGAKPVRLQLSRRKGFNLQALSLATNGLPAVNVARPSMWGNPYHVGQRYCPAVRTDEVVQTPVDRDGRMVALSVSGYERKGIPLIAFPSPLTAAEAVSLYRGYLADRGLIDSPRLTVPLAGKNLACFCKPGEPCHADVLLDLANPSDVRKRVGCG